MIKHFEAWSLAYNLEILRCAQLCNVEKLGKMQDAKKAPYEFT